MPTRPSSQDQRLARLAAINEITGQQAQTQALSSNAMMQQLAQLYQLQSAAEMDPLKARAIELANEEQAHKNAWAQPNSMTDDRLRNAQASVYESTASGDVKPDDWLRYATALGLRLPGMGTDATALPPGFEFLMPPQVQAAMAAQAQAKAAEQAQMKKYQAAPATPAPKKERPRLEMFNPMPMFNFGF